MKHNSCPDIKQEKNKVSPRISVLEVKAAVILLANITTVDSDTVLNNARVRKGKRSKDGVVTMKPKISRKKVAKYSLPK